MTTSPCPLSLCQHIRRHSSKIVIACGFGLSALPLSVDAAPLTSLPPPVAQAFLAWSDECGTTSEATFSEDYLTMVDIDQDGDEDYILNGDGATCVANGNVVARGGGNGGTSLKIFTRQGKAITLVLDLFTQSAEIRSHTSFATVTTPEGTYRIENGSVFKVKRPQGGNAVYSLGR